MSELWFNWNWVGRYKVSLILNLELWNYCGIGLIWKWFTMLILFRRLVFYRFAFHSHPTLTSPEWHGLSGLRRSLISAIPDFDEMFWESFWMSEVLNEREFFRRESWMSEVFFVRIFDERDIFFAECGVEREFFRREYSSTRVFSQCFLGITQRL